MHMQFYDSNYLIDTILLWKIIHYYIMYKSLARVHLTCLHEPCSCTHNHLKLQVIFVRSIFSVRSQLTLPVHK